MSLVRNIGNRVSFPLNMLLIFVVPVFLVTSDVRIAFNSLTLYEYGFNKYDVSGQTGLNSDALKGIGSDIKDYFNSDHEFLDVKIVIGEQQFNLFNDKEINHMKDVKNVLSKVNRVQEISGWYILICLFLAMYINKLRWPQSFVSGISSGCLLTLLLVLITAVGIFFGFESLFRQFHVIFFEAGTWSFDPRSNYLTRLFTEGFFMDASLLIGISVAIQAFVIWLGLWFAKFFINLTSIIFMR